MKYNRIAPGLFLFASISTSAAFNNSLSGVDAQIQITPVNNGYTVSSTNRMIFTVPDVDPYDKCEPGMQVASVDNLQESLDDGRTFTTITGCTNSCTFTNKPDGTYTYRVVGTAFVEATHGGGEDTCAETTVTVYSGHIPFIVAPGQSNPGTGTYTGAFNDAHYDVYYGDINGDNVDDVYLHPEQIYVLLHGDVVTPVMLPKARGLAVFGGLESSVSWLELDESQFVGYGLTKATQAQDYLFGDFNGDNTDDIFIRGANSTLKAFTITAAGSGQWPQNVAVYATNGPAGINLSDRSYALAVVDYNGDGRDDLMIPGSATTAAEVLLTDATGTFNDHITDDSPAFQTATAAGSTNGSFRINEAGAATYNIPLILPAGTAGVAPPLSLNYSSQAGNGLLGAGWSLGGMSSIVRCRKTYGQDNVVSPITFTNDDQFCLDGQRLLLVQGTHGNVGAVYKTEVDSNSRVSIATVSGGEPDTFIVTRQDGSLSTYGATAQQAKRKAGPAGTVSWSLSRFEDSVGNPIEYTYDDSGTQHYITSVQYAYAAGRFNASVHFVYETRPDKLSAFMSGAELSTEKRLSRIDINNTETIAGQAVTTTVRQYTLGYRKLSNYRINNVSHLAGVQECASNGSSTQCLPASTFDWAEAGKLVMGNNTWFGAADDLMGATRLADFNGDGKMDLAWEAFDTHSQGARYDFYLRYALSDGQALNRVQTFNVNLGEHKAGSKNPWHWAVLDYNGDGRSDIARWQRNQNLTIHLSVPDPYTGDWRLSPGNALTAGNAINITSEDVEFVDVNGDGLVDMLMGSSYRPLVKDSSQAASSSTPYKFGSIVSLTWNFPELDPSEPSYDVITDNTFMAGGDFNGDGATDAILYVDFKEFVSGKDRDEQGEVNVFTKTYAVINNDTQRLKYAEVKDSNGTYPGTHAFIQSPDINGDGLSDVVFSLAAGNSDLKYVYLINNGNGFNAPVDLVTLPKSKRVQLQDVNSDGKLDFVYYDNVSRYLSARLWDNTAFSATLTPVIPGGANAMLADISGDGVLDALGVSRTHISVAIATANKPAQAVIETFHNGLGSSTDITYESLASTNAYDRMTFGVSSQERCVDFSPRGGIRCFQLSVADVGTFYSSLAQPFILGSGVESLGAYRPVMELMAPIYVATHVQSSAPAAGASAQSVNTNATSAISYHYGFGRLQASGRGLLGFEYLQTTDEQTGIQTTTWYRQDYPFVGYPLKTEVRTAPATAGGQGDLLSSSLNEWVILGYQTTWADNLASETTSTAALGPLRTVLKSSTEHSYKTTTNLTATEKFVVSTQKLSTVVTDTIFDDYDNNGIADAGNYFGNPTTITVTTKDGSDNTVQVKKTENTYGTAAATVAMYNGTSAARNVSYRELARLTKADVTTTRGLVSQIRTSTFDYYAQGETNGHAGLLKTQTLEPTNALALTTTNHYDAFGNVTRTLQSGVAIPGGSSVSRTADTIYDATGRYINASVNSLQHTTQQVTARNEQGAPTTVNGLNGLISNFTYDALGRETYRSDNTGAWVQTQYNACTSTSCPAGAAVRIEKTVSGGGWSASYQDILGRTIRSSSVNFNGDHVHTDTEYDSLGRVKRTSEPYSSIALYWTQIDYDALGRVISTTLPGISTAATVHYDGLITTTTNPALQTKTETRNVLSELIAVDNNINSTLGTLTDNEKARLSYEYDVQGNLRYVKTLDPVTPTTVLSTVQMCYDVFSRKIAMQDPDKGGLQTGASTTCPTNTAIANTGWWLYEYNAFGELTQQIDAKAQSSTMTYDLLGRMVTRIDRRDDNSIEGNTTWTYDTAASGDPAVPYGIGQLIKVSDSVSGYQRSHTYLDKGLLSTTTTALPGGSTNMQQVTYDTLGRVDETVDAASLFSLAKSMIKNEYNAYGFLSGIVDANNTSTRYYQVTAMDERGNVTQSQDGNGVTTVKTYDPATGRLISIDSNTALQSNVQNLTYNWDELGNLNWRRDHSGNKQLQENFAYDSLNRLTSATVGTTTESVTYDTMGNITYKSDVGTYKYTSQCTTGYGTHAVCETSDGVVYSYDSNGNMTSDTAVGDVGGRTISYTTFDKPSSIQKGTHTTTFAYGPDRARYKRVDTAGSAVTTTWYLGSVEQVDKPNGTQEIKRYLPGNALVTLYLSTASPVDGSRTLTDEKTRYMYKDHLGSLDVITNDTGGYTVNDQYSFDAWGSRRDAINWSAFTMTQLLQFGSDLDVPAHDLTERGFTWHEMLDEVGVVHMNGRIYEARLGRFLQADIQVQFPTDTQSYNRYSYVHNNPLFYTDSTGYGLDLFDVAKIVVGVVAGAVFQCWSCAAYLIGGISAAQTLHYGGSLGDALIAGVSSAALTYIGGEIIGPSGFGFNLETLGFTILGGITSQLQGGKFGHGFVSAGLGALSGQINLGSTAGPLVAIGRTLVRTVIGGTISEITGGKFANGAAFAAFSSIISEAAQGNFNAGKNHKELKTYGSSEQVQRYAIIAKIS